jgi:16S rRNA processing protein RimM
MVLVGRVVRPHGIRGAVVIAGDTDFAEDRFRAGAAVKIERGGAIETLRIAESFPHQGRWVARFEGVDTMDAAETLRDAELKIDAGELHALASDKFYVHDLIGCRVETTEGETVGTVRDVELNGGTPLLVVESPDGETLVPLAEEICRRVDIAAKTIAIAPPEGLIALNATSPKRR